MGRRAWMLVAVVLGSGVVFLDSTVVNAALPQIGEDLPSTLLGVLEGQSYVYYGYLLTLSALLILAGALSDQYGRRRLFGIGLAGFGATSVLCGLAPTLELLVAFRVLQGAAGAILVPASLAIITASFTGEDRGRAFGIWAGASGATTIFGPVLGGVLVSYVSWRAVFLINVPLIAVALWANYRHVPETRSEGAARFDWVGAVVIAVGIGGLTLGAIRGQAQQWEEPFAFAALIVGALAAIAFPILMARSKDPLVPLDLFKSRNFSVTNLSTLLVYGALYVMIQYFALFAIGTLDYNEVAFGLAVVPGTLFLTLFSARFGALAARHGPRWFMALGTAIIGLGLLWFSRFPHESSPWVAVLDDASSFVPPGDYLTDVLPALVLFGVGLMLMVAPLTTALMSSVPVTHSGVASAVNNAVSRVGPQLAGAVLFIAITASFYGSLAEEAPQVEVSAPAVRAEIAPLNPPPPDVGPEVAAAIDDASTDAFRLAMLLAGLLCLAGAAINAVGISNEVVREAAPEQAEQEPEPVCGQMPGARPVPTPTGGT